MKLLEFDITCEMWREYLFPQAKYRIDNPVKLFLREGGTTHRVLDSNGVVHCLPAPGFNGCALRWKNREGESPCNF